MAQVNFNQIRYELFEAGMITADNFEKYSDHCIHVVGEWASDGTLAKVSVKYGLAGEGLFFKGQIISTDLPQVSNFDESPILDALSTAYPNARITIKID